MKKFFSFILSLFIVCSLWGENQSLSFKKHSDKGICNITITANSLYKKDSRTFYFKDKLTYSYKIDETSKCDDGTEDINEKNPDPVSVTSSETLSIVIEYRERKSLTGLFHMWDWGDWKPSAAENFYFIKDETKPEITSDTIVLSSTNYISSNIITGFNVKDTGSGLKGDLKYSINGGSKKELTSETNYAIKLEKEGKYTIELEASDNVNNIETVTFTVVYDCNAPTLNVNVKDLNDTGDGQSVSFNTDTNNGKTFDYVKDCVLSVNANDDFSPINKLTCEIDGKKVDVELIETKDDSGYHKSFKIIDNLNNSIFTETKEYHVEITAYDMANNSITKNFTIKVDKSGPEIRDISTKDINGKNAIDIQKKDWQKAKNIPFTISATAKDQELATSNDNGIDDDSWSYSYSTDEGQNWTNKDGNSFEIKDSGSYKVKFSVKDKLGNEGVSDEYSFKIDNTLPTIDISVDNRESNGKSDKYAQNVKISTKTKDEHSGIRENSLKYQIDKTESDNWTVLSGENLNNKIKELASGKHTIYFKVEDNVGNVSEIKSVEIYIDTIEPQLKLKSNRDYYKDKDNYCNSVTVSASIENIDTISKLSGIDNASWQYSLDSGKTWNTVSSFDNEKNPYVTINKEGTYSIKFRVSSNVGITGYSEVYEYKIDTNAPVITINNSPNSTVDAKHCTFNATVEDSTGTIKSGVKNLSFKYTVSKKEIDDYKEISSEYKNVRVPEGEFTFDKLQTGKYKITFKAEDEAGNEVTKDYYFEVDTSAPVIKVNNPKKDIWEQTKTVSASSSDDDVDTSSWKVFYQYEDESSPTTLEENTVTLTKHGKVYVWFEVSDLLGNKASTYDNRETVLIDTIVPIVTVVKQDLFVDGKRVIQAVATANDNNQSGVDESTYEYVIIPGNIEGTGNTVTLPEGQSVTALFKVKDYAGNKGEGKLENQFVDVTPPVISFDVNKWAFLNSNKQYIIELSNIKAEDNLSSIKNIYYGIDTSNKDNFKKFSNSTKLSINLSELEKELNKEINEGKHEIRLCAEDEYGNSIISDAKSFELDKTNPTVTKVSMLYSDKEINDNDYIGLETFTVKIDAEDKYSGIDSYSYIISQKENLSNENWTAVKEDTVEISKKLFTGINYIFVKVTDKTGNESSIVRKAVFKDSGVPGKPEISSSTHRKASTPNDVEMRLDADFTIEVLSTTRSGISGVYYRLYEGYTQDSSLREVASGYKPIDTEVNLHFEGLKDNKENTFYFLEAYFVGGNGLAGDKDVYQFRIDTTPPRRIIC